MNKRTGKHRSQSSGEAQKFIRQELLVYQARLRGEIRKHGKRFKLIDAFAGAGGMTLGFTESFGHRFEPVWANDFNEDCVETYRTNFGPHCVSGDIVDLLEKQDPKTKKPKIHIPKADVVIGGPPCQGFSLLNKNREGDPRKQLWRPYFDIVKRSQAKIFVMENVPQLLGSFEHGEILGLAEGMGFKVRGGILMAADYGVPQTRRRAIIIGCRFADPAIVFPPLKTHHGPPKGRPTTLLDLMVENGYMPDAEPWRTVRDAIADLPKPVGTEIRDVDPPMNLHFGRTPSATSIQRYKTIPEEGMNRFDLQRIAPELTPGCWIRKTTGGTDLFGRLWWDRPAFTIRTEFYKPEKGRYLHPKQHRPITHREAARLQSFPDSFVFKGTKIEVARQIGNAVPPALAARIADAVYALLTMNVG